jgi:hypothetical protein
MTDIVELPLLSLALQIQYLTTVKVGHLIRRRVHLMKDIKRTYENLVSLLIQSETHRAISFILNKKHLELSRA